MLPNFLVIGAMKAGTSSLYNYLRGHPEIAMARDKEPNFFASKWDRGLEWYESLFDEDVGRARAVGEASTEYSVHPQYQGVPARIVKILPEVRLIYLVRHPIERMMSEYHYNLVRGLEHRASADRSLLNDPTYCDVSRYAMQIEQYLEHFDCDRLLVLKSEDLRFDRLRTLARVWDFLCVDATWEPRNVWQEFNRSSEKRQPRSIDRAVRRIPGYTALTRIAPPGLRTFKYRLTTRGVPSRPTLTEEAEAELMHRLRDDVRRLRRYLGEDFDGWCIA